jgi:dienelactone hydrolase
LPSLSIAVSTLSVVLALPWSSLIRREVVGPDTIPVRSGTLQLRALVWRPKGNGPFPAVLFNHGSGYAAGRAADGVLDQQHPETIGPVFARHGFVFLYLFRRGDGLSRGQGQASGDAIQSALQNGGALRRDQTQLWLLDNLELKDDLSALKVLRALPQVDKNRVAVVGHDFGGSLSLILAERDPSLRAAVVFGAAARTWEQSAPLRGRLMTAVSDSKVPTMFVYAANDYSVAPGQALAAEMTRLKKPHQLKVYPRVGHTPQEGHAAVYHAVSHWEQDVFAFLDHWTAAARH